jgi:hypothetical protein
MPETQMTAFTDPCRQEIFHVIRITAFWLALAGTLLTVKPAFAQGGPVIQSFEVTPFIGGRFGGSFDIESPEGATVVRASLKDAVSYGVSAGVRFDDLSMIEFSWTRSKSGLRFETGIAPTTTSLSDVTLNQFHADFTREFVLDEVKGLRPFLMGSVGATHLGTVNDGFTRFSFGLGTGLKLFLSSNLGIRFQAQWVPIWVDPEVKGFACAGGAGCIVVLSGRLTQQFEVSAGPVFRF